MKNNQLRIYESQIFPIATKNIKLKQICVFPIKSGGPFKISTQWPLTSRGLKYDREWMIVNFNGVCVSQKSNTKLCLIRPIIDLEKNIIQLRFPYMDAVEVTLSEEQQRNQNISVASLCQSKVCGDRIDGIDCGDVVAKWLSDALCTPDLRLIRQSVTDKRKLKKKIDVGEAATAISLANQAQFLLINSTSVHWLIKHVDDWEELHHETTTEQLDGCVDRFRGNLVVETATALDELKWNSIQIGQIQFAIAGPCTRCQMICIDQRTGDKTTEPLRTIAREFQGKINFGIYLNQIMDNDCVAERYISCDDYVKIENKIVCLK